MTPEVMLALLQGLPRVKRPPRALIYEGAGPGDVGQLMVDIFDIVEDWPERHRAIVAGVLHGWGKTELAEHIGVSRKQVHRVMAKLRRAM